jgi:type II secretory pathway pseudopilin PulG
MHGVPSRISARLFVQRRPVISEKGDTLVELLVALIIISIAVVALIGSLLVSTSSSITNRGVVNLDGILRNFAESARYEIQTRPQDGTNGPRFDCNATSYPIVSDPYPTSGTASVTQVVLFVAGFAAGQPTVSVNGQAVSSPHYNGGGPGSYTILFTPTTYGQIKVTNGTQTAFSRIQFNSGGAGPGATAATFASYQLTTTVSPCSSETQTITVSLENPVAQNASNDTLSFVVGNFAPQPVIVTASSTAADVPATTTFTASVTDNAGNQRTTGTVSWTIVGPHSCTSTTQPSASAEATCTISTSYGDNGTYTATATYTGVGYPTNASGSSQITLLPAAPATNISASYSPTANPPTLTFTDTVAGGGGFSPGAGNAGVGWTVTASDGSTPPCNSTSGPVNSGNNSSWSCVINNPNTALSYTATADYNPANNTNYGAVFFTGTYAIPIITISGTADNADHVKFTESATLPNGFSDSVFGSDKITWSVTGSPLPLAPQPCPAATLLNGSTCGAFQGVTTNQYKATVTFANDGTASPYDPNLASTTATSAAVTAP